MPTHHPFRFAHNAIGGNSLEAWQETARRAEALGYGTLCVADHFFTGLGPIASLMAAAAATTTLRIGSLVFGNDFRHPALLAKEVATLDVLSGGRMEFGFGTGWFKDDYDCLGVPLDPVAVKVSRFEEAVRLIKAAFGGEPVTFSGMYYTATNYIGQPKPVQKPYPPLLIGGGGRRMLSLAAREADIVSVNPRTTAQGGIEGSSLSAAYADQRLTWIREAAGARFDQLELNCIVTTMLITDDRRAAATDRLRMWGMPVDDASVDLLLGSPHALIGTISEIVELLLMRRERFGISYVSVFGEETLEPFAPVVARLAGV
jgi:probable F420-dependent oxidoreductase